MPRAKRKAARAKIAYTRIEVFRLACGIPLGPDRFGRGPEALKAMAAAWHSDPALRDEVQELFDRRKADNRVNGRAEPWAATKFDIPGDGGRAEPRARSRSDAAPNARRAVTVERATHTRNKKRTNEDSRNE